MHFHKFFFPLALFLGWVGWSSNGGAQQYLNRIEIHGLPPSLQTRLTNTLLPSPSSALHILWWQLRPQKCSDSAGGRLCQIWGKAPTPYDSVVWESMEQDIRQWLLYHGFRQSRVTIWRRLHNRRVTVVIHIWPGPQDTVQSLHIEAEDTFIRPFVEAYFAHHPIIRKPFDADSLDQWRYALAQYLSEQKIWNFSPQHVRWLVDTTGGRLSVTLKVKGGPFMMRQIDSVIFFITPQRPGLSSDTHQYQTLRVIYPPGMLHLPALQHSFPRPIPRRWDLYHLQLMERRLNNYTAFQAVQSGLVPREIDSAARKAHFIASMNAIMARRYRVEGQIELHTTEENTPLGIQDGRFYGIGFSAHLTNRNFLRRLIQWNTKLQVAFESTLKTRTQVISNTGLQLSTGLLFGRALFLDELTRRFQAQEEQTIIEISHIQDINVSYQRIAFSGQMAYRFINQHNRHTLTPLFLNYSLIHILDPRLQQIIDESTDPFLQQIFRPHVIPLFRYSLFYTDLTRIPRPPWNVVLYWTPIEAAGNLPYLLSRWTRPQPPPYTIGKIPFYQYFKSNVDFRLHRFFSQNTASLHFRFWAGMAFPYGNLNYLPLEVRYYIGGANTLRGWRYQEIGPGGWDAPDASPFERSGEMILLSSTEFRWTITGPWKGAFFIDAGNVWNVSHSYGHPGSLFRWPAFWRQIAVGGGLGIRRDFEYFIIRGDFAVPLHDPIRQRWVVRDWSPQWLTRQLHFHIGVGYPF